MRNKGVGTEKKFTLYFVSFSALLIERSDSCYSRTSLPIGKLFANKKARGKHNSGK